MRDGTPQELLWTGTFGTRYMDRNRGNLPANIALFAKILAKMDPIESLLEFGANIGENLDALEFLIPNARQAAIEIHPDAAHACSDGHMHRRVFNCAIQDFDARGERWDLTFTKGVLIHINPDDLEGVYEKLYNASSHYIVVAEYYSPLPVAISYRGVENALWKRDFAGDLLNKFKDLKLVDYGWIYRRDRFKQDDLNYFILEKK